MEQLSWETVAGTLIGVGDMGGFGIKSKGIPSTSPSRDSLATAECRYRAKITILAPETVQGLTRDPIFSSLAISGASGYDVLTSGRLSDFILRKAGEKGGHGSCSGTFSDPECGIGSGNP